MSTKNGFLLGHAGNTPIHGDLEVLLRYHTLITGTTGAGKTWCMAQVLTALQGQVPQLILDTEGDFRVLRSAHPYIIVAADDEADVQADPKTARRLALALLEASASAILDISNLRPPEQLVFVRVFLEGLMEAPRAHWRPTLITLDEAHLYAPQAGASASMGAVADVMKRGRKRRFSMLLGTQRLADLDKQVAAGAMNKLVGMMSLDTDIRRASADLGFTPKTGQAKIAALEAGAFLVVGPAFSRKVSQVKVLAPRIMQDVDVAGMPATAPTANTQRLIAALAALQPDPPCTPAETVRPEGPKRVDQDAVAALRGELGGRDEVIRQLRQQLTAAEDRREGLSLQDLGELVRLSNILAEVRDGIAGLRSEAAELGARAETMRAQVEAVLARAGVVGEQPVAPPARSRKAAVKPAERPKSGSSPNELSEWEQRFVDELASLEQLQPDGVERELLAHHLGITPTSGNYGAHISSLFTRQIVDYPNRGMVRLTPEGLKWARVHPPSGPRELRELLFTKLAEPQQRIVETLVRYQWRALRRDEIADELGVSRKSGNLGSHFSRLRNLKAIDYPERGMVALAPHLMDGPVADPQRRSATRGPR